MGDFTCGGGVSCRDFGGGVAPVGVVEEGVWGIPVVFVCGGAAERSAKKELTNLAFHGRI